LWANNDSIVSKVLYVELLSPSAFLVGERTLKIEDKPVSHYFILDSTAKGRYTLRAYTHYLTGFGNNAFFQKQVEVGTNTTEKSVRLAVEGGSLVEGLPSRLFVQTEANLSGQLKDDLGNAFATFVSNKDGLAVVPIVPAKNRNYRVELTFGTNDVRAFTVSKTKTSGATIQVNAIDSILLAKIYTQQLDSDSITTAIYQQNNIVFEQKAIVRPVQILKLPAQLLPVGLLRYVITDNKNQILAERLWLNESSENNLSAIARYNVLDYYVTGALPEKNVNQFLSFCTIKSFKQKTTFTKEQSLTRRGVAIDTKNTVLRKTDLIVWAAAKGFGIHTIKTDTAGIFELKNIDSEGLVELKVQTEESQLVAVKWLPRQIPAIDETKNSDAILTTTGMDVPIIDGKQLEEVVIKARKSFEKVKIRMGVNYPIADKTFSNIQLMSVAASSTFSAIRYVNPFISIKTDKYGSEYLERRNTKMAIIVDGIGLPEGALPPTIDVIEKLDLLGNRVYIYTRNGINAMSTDKPNKPFEGNAFLRGFDVAKN
jgi:hypothetical protein